MFRPKEGVKVSIIRPVRSIALHIKLRLPNSQAPQQKEKVSHFLFARIKNNQSL